MARTRVNYKKIYEDYYGTKVPKGMHVHHKDGNSHNNDPHNLVVVTPEEHVKLHELLGHKIIGSFIKKANNQLGIPCSPSKKKNISKSLKGKELNQEHKIKIASKLSNIRPFLVFNKNTGELVGRFLTKSTCFSELNIPANKIRMCLSGKRHSSGNYYLIYEDKYTSDMDIAKIYNDTIKNSFIKMGKSQKERLCKKRLSLEKS